MKKKVLTILYGGKNVYGKGSIPMTNKKSLGAYEYFSSIGREQYNFETYIVADRWFQKDGFERGWQYQNGSWTLVKKKIKPNIVMNKWAFGYDQVPFLRQLNQAFLTVNPWELDLLCSDKLLTNITFADTAVPTVFIRNNRQLLEKTKHFRSSEIVIKPRNAHGGEGIQIVQKKSLESVDIATPSIAQAFIDTRKGIPGIMKGIHDFRILYAGEKPFMTFIRIPKKGERLCNFAQGASAQFVPLSKMPKKLKPITQTILRHLEVFPYKLFSVDFFFNNAITPYLVELNAKPTMYFPKENKKQEENMHHAIWKYYTSIL